MASFLVTAVHNLAGVIYLCIFALDGLHVVNLISLCLAYGNTTRCAKNKAAITGLNRVFGCVFDPFAP